MPVLWIHRSVCLAVPVRFCHLPELYERKFLGHVMQWDYLAMPRLRGLEWVRQPIDSVWVGICKWRKISLRDYASILSVTN